MGWCQRSSFPHVWGWPGREQICLIPAERSMRSKSAAPLRARRPEAAAIVVHDMGGQAPLLYGAGEGLPGDFGCGAGIDADRDQSTRVIVEDVHDPHRLPIGEGPGGGVDLPSVVGPGPFESSPGSMGTLARLRRPIRAAPGHGEWWQPMERSHRGVRGGRRWPGRRSQREVPCAAG